MQWFGTDGATQLGVWTAAGMDARIAADAVANPATIAFDEASTLLVAAGHTVASLSNTVYQSAKSAMMCYAASLWLQSWFDNLNYVASETGRDGQPDSIKRRIRHLQQQAVNYWAKINIRPDWALNDTFYSTELIKS